MPTIVNRRPHKLSISLSEKKTLILPGGESAELSDREASSFGVKSALRDRDIAVFRGGSARGSSKPKETQASEKPEKVDRAEKPGKNEKSAEDSK